MIIWNWQNRPRHHKQTLSILTPHHRSSCGLQSKISDQNNHTVLIARVVVVLVVVGVLDTNKSESSFCISTTTTIKMSFSPSKDWCSNLMINPFPTTAAKCWLVTISFIAPPPQCRSDWYFWLLSHHKSNQTESGLRPAHFPGLNVKCGLSPPPPTLLDDMESLETFTTEGPRSEWERREKALPFHYWIHIAAKPGRLTYKSVVVRTQDALPLKEAEHMFSVVIQNHS